MNPTRMGRDVFAIMRSLKMDLGGRLIHTVQGFIERSIRSRYTQHASASRYDGLSSTSRSGMEYLHTINKRRIG